MRVGALVVPAGEWLFGQFAPLVVEGPSVGPHLLLGPSAVATCFFLIVFACCSHIVFFPQCCLVVVAVGIERCGILVAFCYCSPLYFLSFLTSQQCFKEASDS